MTITNIDSITPTDSETIIGWFDLEEFVKALNIIRHNRFKSWRQVGLECGISPSSLSRMYRGQGTPNLQAFASLVVWSGVQPLDFIKKVGA